jgi:hypothetical protein
MLLLQAAGPTNVVCAATAYVSVENYYQYILLLISIYMLLLLLLLQRLMPAWPSPATTTALLVLPTAQT